MVLLLIGSLQHFRAEDFPVLIFNHLYLVVEIIYIYLQHGTEGRERSMVQFHTNSLLSDKCVSSGDSSKVTALKT